MVESDRFGPTPLAMEMAIVTEEELEKLTPAEKRYLEHRQQLWRTALEDALIKGPELRNAMRDGKGVNWDSLAPLTAQERTLVFRELRHIWGIEPN
jgi:hypothetical protein